MAYEKNNRGNNNYKGKSKPRYQGDEAQKWIMSILKGQAIGYLNGDPLDNLFTIHNATPIPTEELEDVDLIIYPLERRVKSDRNTGEYINIAMSSVVIDNNSALPKYFITANCNWRNGFQSFMAVTKIGDEGPLPKETLRGIVKEQKEED